MATFITCNRCQGNGRLAHFGHVNNGVCLKCRGAGKVVKTKRVVTLEVHYTAVTDNGSRVMCGTDKARAEFVSSCEAVIYIEDVSGYVSLEHCTAVAEAAVGA